MKSAVSRALAGGTWDQSDRWHSLRTSFGIDVSYCQAGVKGVHKKGLFEKRVEV